MSGAIRLNDWLCGVFMIIKYLVLGTNRGGTLIMAPLGLAYWFGVRHGALTFHWGIGATLFNSKRAAQRAIDRTQKMKRKHESEHTIVEFKIIKAYSA